MSTTGLLANGLYPIIRRARRPLVVVDGGAAPAPAPPAAAKSTVETLKPQDETNTKQKKPNDGVSQN
jgi:hypothetical protein